MKRHYRTALMKSVVSIVLASLASVTLVACGGSDDKGTTASDSKLQEVRLGVLKSGLNTVIAGIAESEGEFEKHGIAAKIQNYQSGQGSIQAQELLTNKTDAFFGALGDVLNASSASMSNGQEPPLAIIGVATSRILSLVLDKKLPFEQASDLEGLKIGVSSPGSTYIPLFATYLDAQGTSIDKLKIKLVPVEASNMPAALQTHQIDGFLHSEPTSSIAITNGVGKRALSGDEFGDQVGDVCVIALAVRRDWLKSHSKDAKNLIRALDAAGQDYTADSVPEKEESLNAYVQTDPKVLAQIVEENYQPTMQPLRPSADAFWSTTVDFLKERGDVPPDMVVDDLFDFTFADEVKAS